MFEGCRVGTVWGHKVSPKFRDKLPPTAVLASLIVYFGAFIRIDPEPHHDGVMLGAAIAVSEGRIPNKEVFTQYGPLTPMLQGIWLRFTEPSLLSLRTSTAILLAINGLLLYLILTKFLPSKISSLLSISWGVSYPFFILPVNLPWASVIATFFTLIAMLVMLQRPENGYIEIKIAFITVLLTLGIFVRIHMVISVLIIGIYCFWLWARQKSPRLFILWLISFSLTLTLSLVTLQLFGALNAYIEQCLLWPISYYAAPSVGLTKGEIVARALLLFFPGFLFLFYLSVNLWNSSIAKAFKISAFTIFTCLVLFLSNYPVNHKSYLNPIYVLVSLSQNFSSIVSYSSVALIFVYIWKERTKLAFLDFNFISVAIGASLISHLYPAHDTLHLYWIAPGVIAAVVIYACKRGEGKAKIPFSSLVPVLYSTIVISVVLGVLHLGEKRVGYSDPVLRGMIGDQATAKPIDDMLTAIRSLPRGSTIEFDCAHGLFAVAGGRYLASDERFVNWGTDKVQTTHDYTLICDLSEETAGEIREAKVTIKEVELVTGQILVLVDNLGRLK
jgi:hypothetical protein